MKQRKIKNRLLELMQERERQTRRRIKQHEIAQFVGVADHTIMNWIRNDNISRLESRMVEKLCDYFDCELNDLLYFEYVEEDESAPSEQAED
jgi:DNA-binding Xre family transcriptional regulator